MASGVTTGGSVGSGLTSGSSAGTSGSAGISGSAGVSGSAGSSGTTGVSGTTGSSGTTGTSGAAGVSGTTGISGTTGTSGTTGAAGTSGTGTTAGSITVASAAEMKSPSSVAKADTGNIPITITRHKSMLRLLFIVFIVFPPYKRNSGMYIASILTVHYSTGFAGLARVFGSYYSLFSPRSPTFFFFAPSGRESWCRPASDAKNTRW